MHPTGSHKIYWIVSHQGRKCVSLIYLKDHWHERHVTFPESERLQLQRKACSGTLSDDIEHTLNQYFSMVNCRCSRMGGQPESPSIVPLEEQQYLIQKRISEHYSGFSPAAVFSYEPKYVQSMYIWE